MRFDILGNLEKTHNEFIDFLSNIELQHIHWVQFIRLGFHQGIGNSELMLFQFEILFVGLIVHCNQLILVF